MLNEVFKELHKVRHDDFLYKGTNKIPDNTESMNGSYVEQDIPSTLNQVP